MAVYTPGNGPYTAPMNPEQQGPIQTTDQVLANSGLNLIDVTPDLYYEKQFLKTLRVTKDAFIMMKFAFSKKDIPVGYQRQSFQRIHALKSAEGNILDELESPEGVSARISTVAGGKLEYGNIMYWSDKNQRKFLLDYMRQYIDEMSVNAVETIDAIVRNAVIGGATQKAYAGGKLDVASLEAGDTLRIRDLHRSALSMHVQGIDGAEGGKYVAIVSPAQFNDIATDPILDFTSRVSTTEFMQNGSRKLTWSNLVIYEYKKALVQQKGKAPFGWTDKNANFDVHVSIFFGAEAFATTGISGHSKPTFFHYGFGQNSLVDPMGKISFFGWRLKEFGAYIVLQEAIEIFFSVPTDSGLFYTITEGTVQA